MIELIKRLIHDHWSQGVAVAVSAFFGWWFGKRRAQRAWRKREFLDRLNVSLTSIHDGKLKIRTLMEKRCEEVFLNQVAVETILAKASQTTADNPLLPLPEEERWFYLNSVLNELSEKFAAGFMRRELGQPIAAGDFLICLTCEAAGAARTRKIRSMVVAKSLLTNLPAEQPRLEAPSHATRWRTLQQLAAQYAASPSQFLEVELCL